MEPEVLAACRAAQLTQLNQSGYRVYVYPKIEGQDDYGADTIAYAATPARSYPCKAQNNATSGSERSVAGKTAGIGQWTLILPWNAQVDETDLLELRATATQTTTERFEVIEVPTERADRQTLQVQANKAV